MTTSHSFAAGVHSWPTRTKALSEKNATSYGTSHIKNLRSYVDLPKLNGGVQHLLLVLNDLWKHLILESDGKQIPGQCSTSKSLWPWWALHLSLWYVTGQQIPWPWCPISKDVSWCKPCCSNRAVCLGWPASVVVGPEDYPLPLPPPPLPPSHHRLHMTTKIIFLAWWIRLTHGAPNAWYISLVKIQGKFYTFFLKDTNKPDFDL